MQQRPAWAMTVAALTLTVAANSPQSQTPMEVQIQRRADDQKAGSLPRETLPSNAQYLVDVERALAEKRREHMPGSRTARL